MSGIAEAAWVVFVIVLPYLGMFVYLIARGDKIHEHQLAAIDHQQQMVDQYIRETAGTSSPTVELSRLADLKDRGAIDDAEFAALKAKVVG